MLFLLSELFLKHFTQQKALLAFWEESGKRERERERERRERRDRERERLRGETERERDR